MSTKEELGELLKIEEKRKRAAAIEAEMGLRDFWLDREKSTKFAQELSQLQKEIEEFEKANTEEELAKLELKTLLSGPHDVLPAILSIHAGTGGTEAQDWASMLLRMYQRYGQHRGFEMAILDQTPGEEAGIKSATLEIRGPLAFGYLKSEAGVHRLVRISPFDADRARHTSFALVEVIPEIPAAEEAAIDPKELKIDTFRASGHGGQNVNKVETAVRLTHLPTNIVVSVQTQRSQGQNRDLALKILQAKLYQLKLKEQEQKTRQLRGEYLAAEWGNQIRSYVLQPYQMVKDHRTGYETADTKAVLDGELDGFVESYLKSNRAIK
ncbi:peptide chain release factor 2 [Candidatus Berkelbacteria bacterium]|nr:peptide chain release factor 2 [Candidatus Berkelbacteria bacterium]